LSQDLSELRRPPARFPDPSQYSTARPRFPVKVDARWAIRMTNELINMRPFVVLAVRVMPPGRRRLQMVKLAHELDGGLDPTDSTHRAA
jgi:hypothetical protein